MAGVDGWRREGDQEEGDGFGRERLACVAVGKLPHTVALCCPLPAPLRCIPVGPPPNPTPAALSRTRTAKWPPCRWRHAYRCRSGSVHVPGACLAALGVERRCARTLELTQLNTGQRWVGGAADLGWGSLTGRGSACPHRMPGNSQFDRSAGRARQQGLCANRRAPPCSPSPPAPPSDYSGAAGNAPDERGSGGSDAWCCGAQIVAGTRCAARAPAVQCLPLTRPLCRGCSRPASCRTLWHRHQWPCGSSNGWRCVHSAHPSGLPAGACRALLRLPRSVSACA